jgi:Arc/MetJ family transcription regulator
MPARATLTLDSTCQNHCAAVLVIWGFRIRMETRLNIDDTVMAELKREAARQGRTMSELVETALRLLLRSQRKRGRIPALPKFRSGGALVDVADRDAPYHAMEGR